jgi:hypothetical protein
MVLGLTQGLPFEQSQQGRSKVSYLQSHLNPRHVAQYPKKTSIQPLRNKLTMSAAAIHNRGILHYTFYYLNTLYLFTGDQLLEMVFPSTVFVLAVISWSVLSLPSQNLLSICSSCPPCGSGSGSSSCNSACTTNNGKCLSTGGKTPLAPHTS